MTVSKRNSYVLLGIVLVLAGWGGLGTLLTTTLFCYFVLNKLTILRYKWLTIGVYIAIVSVIGGLIVYFLDQAARALPKVVSTAVPMIVPSRLLGAESPSKLTAAEAARVDWRDTGVHTRSLPPQAGDGGEAEGLGRRSAGPHFGGGRPG